MENRCLCYAPVLFLAKRAMKVSMNTWWTQFQPGLDKFENLLIFHTALGSHLPAQVDILQFHALCKVKVFIVEGEIQHWFLFKASEAVDAHYVKIFFPIEALYCICFGFYLIQTIYES